MREAFGAIHAGDWPRAAAVAARAVAAAPSSADAHHLVAVTARHTGRLEDAIASLERAVKLRPAFFEAWLNLGNAWLEAGDAERALERYAKAFALNPDSAPLHNNIGIAQRDAVGALRRYLCADKGRLATRGEDRPADYAAGGDRLCGSGYGN